MQYRELFNFFDVDKDRTWGSIEFAQRMTDIGCDCSVESASNLLYFAGVRDVDRITYDDFVQLMPKLKAFRKLLEKDAMKMFKMKDPDVHRRVQLLVLGARRVLGRARRGFEGSHPPAVQHGPGDGRQDWCACARAVGRAEMSAGGPASIKFALQCLCPDCGFLVVSRE